ncbi:MAG: antitoxin [bacterium]
MGMMDKLKDMLGQNKSKGAGAVDKTGDAFDAKTGGKYAGQTDMGQERAKDYLNKDDGTTGV